MERNHTMKYYLCSIHENEGTLSNDSNDLQKYYELGWETHYPHIEIKKLLLEGKFNNEVDFIVTHEDRMFLYSKDFKNVISYSTFKKINPDESQIEKYCMEFVSDKSFFHQNVPNHKELVINLDFCSLENFDVSSPFYIIHPRLRDWNQVRNICGDFWKKITSHFEQKNMKGFVFGKEGKGFENENLKHVSLREYCSLAHHENCKFVVGSMSGGTMIMQFCSNPQAKIFVILSTGYEGGSFGPNTGPLFHDPLWNFTNSPTFFFKEKNIEKLLNAL